MTKISSIARRLVILAIGVTLPLALAQSPPRRDTVNRAVNTNPPALVPPSMKRSVQVMVEFQEEPAAAPYARAMRAAQKEAEAQETAALANPNSAAARAAAPAGKKVEISAAAAAQVDMHALRLDQTQQATLPALTGGNIRGKVLYRVQHAYNGIALSVSPDQVAEIAKLPGVKAVHPMHPKYLTAAFSDIDFLRTRVAPGGLWTSGAVHGEGIRVAIIDTGLDYVHVNFGGDGNYKRVTDKNPNGHFPSAKVPGGYDFAGDAYDPEDPDHDTPKPDKNPFDCNGHGTACASLIGGYGENNDGTQYKGPYNATQPVLSSLKISPGFAPQTLLYPLRVFGCSGATNLVIPAIDWAISHRMDVISMSLGSDEGYADDPAAIAASNAAAAGIIVCSAAGNAGDSYYIHSSPASASGTLSVAASYNNQNGVIFDVAITGNSPNLAGKKFGAIYSDSSPNTSVTDDVVYAQPRDASTPLTNAAQVAGHIALIDRGNVFFSVKAQNAMAAGATGIIVVNNVPGESFIQITSTADPALTIPDVLISMADGATIKAAANFDTGTTGDNGTGVPAVATNVTIAPGEFKVVDPVNPPGSPAGKGSPDTVASYTSRGPRLPDSAIKPDLTAPAEVVGVAANNTGTGSANFNGTSSATPHVSGAMALLRQYHPNWSVQELNALICDTATHDLTTTVGGKTKIGIGRVGAGRIDLLNAAKSKGVAYSGSDPDLQGVSFGVVEVPVDGDRTFTKNITLVNKGATRLTYTLSLEDNPKVSGASFSFPNGKSVSVPSRSSITVPVAFTVMRRQLRHEKEASVDYILPGPAGRQWLTESAAYAVFTPSDGSSTLRVAVYAAPKPVSSMHAALDQFTPNGQKGTFNVTLTGTPVNTGPNYGVGFDIISLVKPYELQYVSESIGSANPPTDPNIIKYVGVGSDYANQGSGLKKNTVLTFAIEGFGNAPVPEFNSSDKDIFFDTNRDGDFDFVVFFSSVPNGSVHSNTYTPYLFNLHSGDLVHIPFPYVTNVLDPVFNPDGSVGGKDTNSFNNSVILADVPTSLLADPANGLPPVAANGRNTRFDYVVVTFDRNGDLADATPILSYDTRKPGLDAEGSNSEPFMYNDLPSTSIPVEYNVTAFQNNGSLGLMLVHMHNGDGLRTDVIRLGP